MTISPKWGFWLSIGAAIISALLLCTTQFTTLFGQHTADQINAGIIIVNAIINGVNAVLHAIPAAAPATSTEAAKFPLGPTVTVKP